MAHRWTHNALVRTRLVTHLTQYNIINTGSHHGCSRTSTTRRHRRRRPQHPQHALLAWRPAVLQHQNAIVHPHRKDCQPQSQLTNSASGRLQAQGTRAQPLSQPVYPSKPLLHQCRPCCLTSHPANIRSQLAPQPPSPPPPPCSSPQAHYIHFVTLPLCGHPPTAPPAAPPTRL